MITISINVERIDKSKFFQGKKGKYLDLVLIETPNSEYGDYLVKQGQSKEERKSGAKAPIIGNAKIVQSRGNRATKEEGNSDGDTDGW